MKPEQSVQYIHLQGPSYIEIIIYTSILYSLTHTCTHIHLSSSSCISFIWYLQQSSTDKWKEKALVLGWVAGSCALVFSRDSQRKGILSRVRILVCSYLSPHVSLATWEKVGCNGQLNLSDIGQRGLLLSPSYCQSLSGGGHKISFMAKIISTGPNTTLQSRR